MAKIPVYEKNVSTQLSPQTTTRMSREDPMGAALQSFGRGVSNVANVAIDAYEAKKEKQKDAQDKIQKSQDLAAETYATDFLKEKRANAELQYDDIKSFPEKYPKVTLGSKEEFVKETLAGTTDEVAEKWNEWGASKEAFEKFKLNAGSDEVSATIAYRREDQKNKAERAGYVLKSSGDKLQTEALIAMHNGDAEEASSLFTMAKEKYNGYANIHGEEARDQALNAGRYSGYQAMLQGSQDDLAVNDAVAMMQSDEYLKPEQVSSLMQNADARKRGIRSEQAAVEREQTVNRKKFTDDQLAQIQAGVAFDESELPTLIEKGLTDVQGAERIRRENWKLNLGVPTDDNRVATSRLSEQIGSGQINSYRELEKHYLNVTPEQYSKLEQDLALRIVPSISKEVDVDKLLTKIGSSKADVKTLSDAIDSINTAEITMQEKEAVQVLLEKQFELMNTNPKLSLAYKSAVADIMELERFTGLKLGSAASELSVTPDMTEQQVIEKRDILKSLYDAQVQEALKTQFRNFGFYAKQVPETSQSSEVIRTVNGKQAVFNAETKEFVRWQ